MEKLHYTVELADNGIIVTDDVGAKNVFQENPEESTEACYRRGLSESIGLDVVLTLINGTPKLEPKDKYNIKIEIR